MFLLFLPLLQLCCYRWRGGGLGLQPNFLVERVRYRSIEVKESFSVQHYTALPVFGSVTLCPLRLERDVTRHRRHGISDHHGLISNETSAVYQSLG
jgi:hypothetical protein